MNKLLFICGVLLFANMSYSQDYGEPFTISSVIGDTLLPSQRNQLGLFSSKNGFKWAVFYLDRDSVVNAKVGMERENSVFIDTVLMNIGTMRSIHSILREKNPNAVDSVKIKLKDETIVSGEVLGETKGMVIIETAPLGMLRISKSEIEELVRRKVGPGGEKYFGLTRDPNETRAFLMPTANTLAAGRGYIGDYELFLLTGAFGVTDWLMLNAGTILLPLPVEDEVINYGVKVRLYQAPDKFGVAAGLQVVTPFKGAGSSGLWYAVLSFGNSDKKANVAFSKTFSYVGGSSIIVGLSGDARIAEHVKLLAETWIIEGETWGPLMVGVRFFGDRLSGDIGMMYPIGEANIGSPIGWPVANLVYNF